MLRHQGDALMDPVRPGDADVGSLMMEREGGLHQRDLLSQLGCIGLPGLLLLRCDGQLSLDLVQVLRRYGAARAGPL